MCQRIDGRCGRSVGSGTIRRSQVECSVRTLLVEVADVDAEDVLELAAPEDQKPIEAFPAFTQPLTRTATSPLSSTTSPPPGEEFASRVRWVGDSTRARP